MFAIPAIERLREDNARRSCIDPDQFAALLKHLPAPLVPRIEFACYTARRIRSECCLGMATGRSAGACVVRLDAGSTKNNKARVMAYGACQPSHAVIERQWSAHESPEASGVSCGLVFHRNGGQRIRDIAHACGGSPATRRAWSGRFRTTCDGRRFAIWCGQAFQRTRQ